MASVFRRKYTKLVDGKKVKKQSKSWYVKYRDAGGIERRVKGYKDKIATQQLAAKLEKEAELAREGIVDRYKEHRKKPLVQHLADFRQSLLDKGDTEDYARLTHNRVKAILTACNFVFISDIQPSRVQRYLAERKRDGLGIKSCNHYLTAAKNFLNWMVDDQRVDKNSLEHLKGQNAKTDIRRQRRALMPDEISTLLTATIKGPKHHNLTGKERYMLYTLALTTGFRCKELASVTWQSLNLSVSEPSITVVAGYTKNRHEATLPLREDVARLFRQWSAEGSFSKSSKVFQKFNKSKGAAMIRRDLEAVGIAYQDEAGRFADFHGQRHSFITCLGRSGATVKETQALARHSTSALTLDVYTHIGLHDERRAIEKMPQLHDLDGKNDAGKNRSVALRTGTDNKPVDTAQDSPKELTPKLTPFLTPTAYSGCDQSSAVGNEQDNSQENDRNGNCLNSEQLDKESHRLATVGMGEKEMGRSGFEPPTHGFSVRICSL